MATKPLRPCGDSTCPNLSDEAYCPEHRKERNQRRGSATQRGYDARWRLIRLAHLRKEPLCRHCAKDGRVEPATDVDHIDGNVSHMHDDNLQSLCHSCHSIKTARENGSFGRAKQSNNEGDS